MFDIGPKAIYSMGDMRYDKNTVIADALLTPLLYPYNNLDENNTNLAVIGDMPKLVALEK